MYSTRSGLVLGFHGCDQSVVKKVLNHETLLRKSENVYDWLGPGIYFWENSPSRALEYAQSLKDDPARAVEEIEQPAVIGAIIDLGYCLDLLDFENLTILAGAYGILQTTTGASGQFPKNKSVGSSQQLLWRELDCAVFKTVHKNRAELNQQPFDSVRAMFSEGDEIYPNAGFREKNHIQLCICNPNCIKGFFLPRELDTSFAKV